MMKNTSLLIANVLVLLSLVSPRSFSASLNRSTNEDVLVDFSPKVYLESGVVCQGIRTGDEYIATSEECSQRIKSQSLEKDIQVINWNEILIGEIKGNLSEFSRMRIRIINHTDSASSVYPFVNDFLPGITNAYTYLISDNGLLVKELQPHSGNLGGLPPRWIAYNGMSHCRVSHLWSYRETAITSID